MGALVYAYNCNHHDSTGFSPYFLMIGRETLPIDIQLGVSTDGVGRQQHYQYVAGLRSSLQEAYPLAKENTAKINAGNKRHFDAKLRYQEFIPIDKVLLQNLGPMAKHCWLIDGGKSCMRWWVNYLTYLCTKFVGQRAGSRPGTKIICFQCPKPPLWLILSLM